jgi:outer membrane protein assembly factor BamE (lipoprotein component of BamABCDE complex)
MIFRQLHQTRRMFALSRLRAGLLAAGAALAMLGCDVQNISELEEGFSTEADVREKFGEPEAVWDGPDGAQIYEYNRQPAGHRNYMITIGPDGRMASLRQVLTPENFARVQPGMDMTEVRKMLGKPMKITRYELKQEMHYDWRYLDGPGPSDSKIFTVVFDNDLKVVSTLSVRDPELDRH